MRQERRTTYLLENSLLEVVMSWDGEPDPERGFPGILLDGARPGDMPNGDLTTLPDVGSPGEVLAVGEVERAWPDACCEA